MKEKNLPNNYDSLSVEELTDIIDIDEKSAADLIMEAREHWFKEDE